MQTFRLMGCLGIIAITGIAISGCASQTQVSSSCSYKDYPTAADASKDADLVSRATIVSVKAQRVNIQLTEPIIGGGAVGEDIIVMSDCDSISVPNGTKDVEVFLVKTSQGWEPVNPHQGIRKFDPNEFAGLRVQD
ncbi:hypothetical protein [Curtobacterium flaccumfaciens]|uniref:hypothetical protein n=1 Tax=Curtobacterium flaccumfaciens TaxID=2035 RepID=UPI00188A8309|nr:hypothetical protein [Curtobacterium flaccumfaciens]MBF4629303.1 hypothetical protein [Curtobacterium flaccumfaciens]